MRQENIIFEQSLKALYLFWRFTGVHINYNIPYRSITITRLLRDRWFFIFNLVVLDFSVICAVIQFKEDTIQEILYMIPSATLCCLGTFKVVFFLKHGNYVHGLIKTLRELQSADDYEEKEILFQDFVGNRLKFLNKTNKLLLIIGCTGIAGFCIGPLVIIFTQYWFTNELKLFLPFILWYPFDTQDYKYYFISYIHQFWLGWVTVFFGHGPDIFYYTCSTFIHNQFLSLHFDLRNISNETFNTEHLEMLVHRHRELIRCVNELSEIYANSNLFNVVSSSFIICLAGFNIKANEDWLMMIPFAMELFLALTQIFLFCYYGDLLMRASIEVGDAIFESKWYQLDASSMKYCFIMLMRSQKPCKISAKSYTDINLKTYGRIISSAWSYFTLINTMYSK